jgi:hypothetical protein
MIVKRAKGHENDLMRCNISTLPGVVPGGRLLPRTHPVLKREASRMGLAMVLLVLLASGSGH